MPWLERSPEMERTAFIMEVQAGEETFTALCRKHGIARQTGYDLLRRVEKEGLTAVLRKRPLAKTYPHATPELVADAVVELRKKRPTWGPKKIRAELMRQTWPKLPMVPACSTIGDILTRRGLIAPRKRRLRLPPMGGPLSEYTGPNAVWCMDHKGHFALDDRSRCHPLTMMDGFSRYLLKCEALESTAFYFAWPHIEQAFREFGLPVRMRTDNGPPFVASGAPAGLSELGVMLVKLGIEHERIEPGHPEQNGRLERFHLTLEEAIAGGPHALDVQKRRFDAFRGEYNHERPHEGLGQKVPAAAYETSWRAYPAKVGSPSYAYDGGVRRVKDNGAVAWGGHQIKLTRSLAGEPVFFQETGEEQWTVMFGHLRLVDIDLRGDEPKIRAY